MGSIQQKPARGEPTPIDRKKQYSEDKEAQCAGSQARSQFLLPTLENDISKGEEAW